MEEPKKLTGIQKFVLAGFGGMLKATIEQYASLSEDEKEKLHKRCAKHMFDKAVNAELKEPYDKIEIDFIKRHLDTKDLC